MARSTPAPKRDSPPPPVSLNACWDKGKWHFDAPSFPAYLPREAGWRHIVAALRFLDQHGQLTASGKDELVHAEEEIALLSEHIRASARAFLDENYKAYLGAIEGYDQQLPMHVLESAWNRYTTKYDISKRPLANAYQKLLLDHAYSQNVDSLLRALDRVPGLAARLREALAVVPEVDRALIEAVLAAREGDPVDLASSWHDPDAFLRALRYLDSRRCALTRLRAALVLDGRQHPAGANSSRLALLVHAMNIGATPEAESAWRNLTESEKERLASVTNSLFREGEETHLALCAMRTVGDPASLTLIEKSVGDRREGTTQYSDGRIEPSWDPIRREAREAIRRRHGLG